MGSPQADARSPRLALPPAAASASSTSSARCTDCTPPSVCTLPSVDFVSVRPTSPPLGADAHALLGERALPVLRGLAELTGESANLAVLTQGLAEYVAQAPGSHTMRIFTEVGNRVELHCTGVGKALLAAVTPAQAGRLATATPLTARTAGTITDRTALHAEIALTRARGYALDEGEMEAGVRCVAVGMAGKLPMAVSVSGPAVRMTDDLIASAVSALRTATAQLRRQLP